MANGTTAYVRGTRTERTRTSELARTAGRQVLTSAEPADDGTVYQPRSKMLAKVRTTASAKFALTTGRGRASRYYILHFTDGTHTKPTVAHEAWTTVATDSEV